ncbi:astacin [Dictyocaulus viviparus]|uniref:Zinc metalloproteinase n=1 Tax=Dictyocaulus viviparus TaxID=29172 RepID=A0A0D8X7E7_DICVI|nr:astacin [Dictyocaulus viviparus]
MKPILSPLLLFCIGVELYNANALGENRGGDESYRKELEEESQQLENETDAENTKVFLEKLLNMEEKIENELKLTPQQNEELNFTMRNYVGMRIDHVDDNGDTIEEVNKYNRIDKALYQGDIILSQAQAEEIIEENEGNAENRTKRQAMNLGRHRNSIWPNNRVYYTYVNASDPAIRAFEQAVKDWSNATCIDFYRSDTGILKRNTASQFKKQSKQSNNNYNITYDYGGVMHYGPMIVSKNRKPVVVTHDINYMQTLGSPIISFYEKLMMNVHYKCNDCTKKPSANCQNGGFAHPRNCMVCICPSGYGGDLCDRRPDGCGSVLKANESYQFLVDTVGNKSRPKDRVQFYTCNYWIEAQLGEKIEVIFDNFTKRLGAEGCKYAGVEIKTGSDKRHTGYRFCSSSNIDTRLVSTYNVVPIITYNLAAHPSTTTLRYRSIRRDADAPKSTADPQTSTRFPELQTTIQPTVLTTSTPSPKNLTTATAP